jgi:hypothetical protein
VAKVQAYRDQVRALVLRLIDTAPLTLPVDWNNPWWAIVMGVEHERIHLETSSVLIRQHRLDYVRPQPQWPVCQDSGEAPPNTLVDVPAGSVTWASPSTASATAGTTSTATTLPRCPPSRPAACW